MLINGENNEDDEANPINEVNEEDAQENTDGNIKQPKLRYDYFCDKTRLSNLTKSNVILALMRLLVANLNQYNFATYTLLTLVVRDFLNNDPNCYKTLDISKVTIQRCLSTILGKTFKKPDAETKIIEDVYAKYKSIFDLVKLPSIQSYNQPTEKFSEQIMVNITNHYTMNFGRFQHKYLKRMLRLHISAVYGIDFELPYKLLSYVVKVCQSSINQRTTFKLNLDEENKDVRKIAKCIDVSTLNDNLNEFVLCEQMKFPASLKGLNTSSTNENTKEMCKEKIKGNLWSAIQYFNTMISTLERSSQKAFDLLPILNLGMQHVRLGCRFIVTIYNKYLEYTSPNVKKVKIKEFESNYESYYSKLFNLDYFKNRKDLKNKIPVSFITDGVSVSCMFRTLKRPKKDVVTKLYVKKKLDLEEARVTKGLYDADDVKCSEDYLSKFNKKGSDPNNKTMFHTTSETGSVDEISTASYYHDAHIYKNKKKLEDVIKKSGCKEIYDKLAEVTHKTADIDKYVSYIEIIFKNWGKIWSFNSELKQAKLKYDTNMNKKRAVRKIVRKMARRRQTQRWRAKEKKGKKGKHNEPLNGSLTKNGSPENNRKLEGKYFVQSQYEKVKDLLIMLGIGKGNGSMTISNIKGSGPKGPINTIIKELAKLILVILIDEYKTSQLCNNCETKLEHPYTRHYKRKKRNSNERDEKGFIKESYRMCCCPNSKCHKIWNRDDNSSLAIEEVMERKLLGKDLKGYERKNNHTTQGVVSEEIVNKKISISGPQ